MDSNCEYVEQAEQRRSLSLEQRKEYAPKCHKDPRSWAASLARFKCSCLIIVWHVDPLLGNDREISSYTTAVAR
jgi:hypothetical protein